MKNLILIPTALNVDKEMHLDIGEIPPVLVPISGKPLLDYIIEAYNKFPGEKTYCLLVNENKDRVKKIIERKKYKENIKLIEIDNLRSLGWTIFEGLSKINLSEYDNLIVNFGDTLVDESFETNKDLVLYDDLPETYRWTTFETENNKIIQIKDKINTNEHKIHHVFVGIFQIKNPQLYFQKIEEDPDKGFYSTLMSYLNSTNEYEILKTNKWYDIGHIDNYFQTKKDFINLRYFNTIKIHDKKGILEKTSKHEKFIGEIKWYLQIPQELQSYLPKIFDYSINPDNPFIKMEYYGYPNLGEIYTFGNYNLGIWSHIFDSILYILDEMSRYKLTISEEEARKAREEIFVDKTIQALELMSTKEEFKPLFENKITINGQQYESLNFYKNKIKELCEEHLLNAPNEFNLIHGDLCTSNILYDPKSKITKLIDPRGKFGQHTTYGDFRYDLGKLTHSFNGKYEFIINDLFNLEISNNNITYEMFTNDKHEKITTLFKKRIEEKYPTNKEQIQLIEALQYLSMVRMHFPKTERQFAMLTTGIQLLDPLIEKENKMNIILPMAGLGSRFTKVGITTPKPLIKVRGKQLIKWALDSIPQNTEHNLIFIVRQEHINEFKIDQKLKELFSENITIIPINHTTEGAACTVLLAKKHINNNNPLIILDCDIHLKVPKYFELLKDKNIKGIIPVFRGEGDKWSFSKTDENMRIQEVAEKNRISEFCNMGMYFFQHGKDFVWAAEDMINKNIRFNNEFYISPVFQQLIDRGDQIKAALCTEAWGLGTPEDVKLFEEIYPKETTQYTLL